MSDDPTDIARISLNACNEGDGWYVRTEGMVYPDSEKFERIENCRNYVRQKFMEKGFCLVELGQFEDAKVENSVVLCKECFPDWGRHEIYCTIPHTPCEECGAYDDRTTDNTVHCAWFVRDPRAT